MEFRWYCPLCANVYILHSLFLVWLVSLPCYCVSSAGRANRSIDIWYHRGKMTLSKGFFVSILFCSVLFCSLNYLSWNCCLFGIDIQTCARQFFLLIEFHWVVIVYVTWVLNTFRILYYNAIYRERKNHKVSCYS